MVAFRQAFSNCASSQSGTGSCCAWEALDQPEQGTAIAPVDLEVLAEDRLRVGELFLAVERRA